MLRPRRRLTRHLGSGRACQAQARNRDIFGIDFGRCATEKKSGVFLKGGYTEHVANGDGDFLTKDTLWDFKVSKQTLQSKSVLQLLIYWRLGLHSVHPEYRHVKYLGVYNPRMNMIYRYPVADISDEVIEELDYSTICYPRE